MRVWSGDALYAENEAAQSSGLRVFFLEFRNLHLEQISEEENIRTGIAGEGIDHP